MKKFLYLFLLVIAFVPIVFAGCANPKLDMPSSDATISSNGGSAVMKGDYVYFVNGFESTESLADSNKNKEGEVQLSSIYVAKLVDGVLTDKAQLVSKVAGFENTDLYIFGDYLYFLTPSTNKDATGKVRYDLPALARVRLDGRKFKVLYTPSDYSSGEFSMTEIDGKVYAVFFTGSEIVKFDVKKSKATKLADATSAALVDETTEKSDVVYFTRERNEDEGSESNANGNILEKVCVSNDEVTTLVRSNSTLAITQLTGGRVYYTKDSNYYSDNFSSGTSEKRHSYVEYTSFQSLGSDDLGNQLGFVVGYDSKLYFQPFSASSITAEDIIISDSVTLLGAFESNIYYFDSNNVLKTFAITDNTEKTISSSIGTISASVEADRCGRFLFFMTKPESSEKNIYCFVSDLYFDDEDKTCVAGVFLDGDEPEEKTEE